MAGIVTGYTHVVGRSQYVLDVLRLKIPRALCGSLVVSPGEEGGPLCPECAALSLSCPRCGGCNVSFGPGDTPECDNCGETF
jgi:hypothetical protein